MASNERDLQDIAKLLEMLDSLSAGNDTAPAAATAIGSGDAKLEVSFSAPVSMSVSSSSAPVANPVKKQKNELPNLIGNSTDYQFFIDKEAYESFIKKNKDKKAVYISPIASRKIGGTVTNAYKYKCRIYESGKDRTMADVSDDVLNEVIAILEIEKNMSLLEKIIKSAEIERANDYLSDISAKINEINHPRIKRKFIALKNAYCEELVKIYNKQAGELQKKLLNDGVSVFSADAGNDKKIVNETLNFLNNITEFMSNMSDEPLKDSLAREKEIIEHNFIHFLKDKEERVGSIQEYLFGELARQIEKDRYGDRDKLLKNQKILLDLWQRAQRENSMASAVSSASVDVVITQSEEIEEQHYDNPTLSGCIDILENISQRDSYKEHKEIIAIHFLLNYFKTLEVSPQFMAGLTQNIHILLVQLRAKMLRNDSDVENSIQEIVEIVNQFVPIVLNEAKADAEAKLLPVEAALKEKEEKISEKKEAIIAAREKIDFISEEIKAKDDDKENFMRVCAEEENEEIKSYVRDEILNGEREVRAKPQLADGAESVLELPEEVELILNDRLQDLKEIESVIRLEIKEKEDNLREVSNKLALQKLIQELIHLKVSLLESADIKNIQEVKLIHNFVKTLDAQVEILSAPESEKMIDFDSVLNKTKEDFELAKKLYSSKEDNKFLVELERGTEFLNSCIQDKTIKRYDQFKGGKNIPDRKIDPEHIVLLEKEKELAQKKGFLKTSDNIRSGLVRWIQENRSIFSKKIKSIRSIYKEKRSEFERNLEQLFFNKERAVENLEKLEKEQAILEKQKGNLETEQKLLQRRIQDLNRTIKEPFELFLVSNIYAVFQDSLPSGFGNAILLDDQNRVRFVHNGKLLRDESSISDRGDIPFHCDVRSSQSDVLSMTGYNGACDVIENVSRSCGFTLLYDMDKHRYIEAEANKKRIAIEAKKDREQKRLAEQPAYRSVGVMVADVQQFQESNAKARRIIMMEEEQQPQAAAKTPESLKKKEETNELTREKEEADNAEKEMLEAGKSSVTNSDIGSGLAYETLDSWIQKSSAEAEKRNELIRFQEGLLSRSPQELLGELRVLDRVHNQYKKELERLEEERAEKVRVHAAAGEKPYKEQQALMQFIYSMDQKIQELNDKTSMINNKKGIIVELLNTSEVDFRTLAADDLLTGLSQLNKERRNLERERSEILKKVTAMEIGLLPAADKQKVEADLKEKALRLEQVKQLKQHIKTVLDLSLRQSAEGLQNASFDEEIAAIYRERKAILTRTQELLNSSEEGYYTQERRDREEREFVAEVSQEISAVYQKIADPNLRERLKKVFHLSKNPETILACLLAIDSIAAFLNANPNHGDNHVLGKLCEIIRLDDPISTLLQNYRVTSLLVQCNMEDLPEELSYFRTMYPGYEEQQEIEELEELEFTVAEPQMEEKLGAIDNDDFILVDNEAPLSPVIASGQDKRHHSLAETDEVKRDSMQTKKITQGRKREIGGLEKVIKGTREAILDSYLRDIEFLEDLIRRYREKALDSEKSVLNGVLERLSKARVAVNMLKNEHKDIPAADTNSFKVELNRIDELMQNANHALHQPNVKSIFENFSREAILGFMDLVYNGKYSIVSSSAKDAKQLKDLKAVEDIRQECYQRNCKLFESRTSSARHRLQLVQLRLQVDDLQKAHQKYEKLEERIESIEGEDHKPVAKPSFSVISSASSPDAAQAVNMEKHGFFRTSSSNLATPTRSVPASRTLKPTLSSSSE